MSVCLISYDYLLLGIGFPGDDPVPKNIVRLFTLCFEFLPELFLLDSLLRCEVSGDVPVLKVNISQLESFSIQTVQVRLFL